MKKTLLHIAFFICCCISLKAQDFKWAITTPNSESSVPYPESTIGSVVTDANGNIYVAGSFSGIADFDPGPNTFTMSTGAPPNTVIYQGFVSKYDASGALVWAKKIDGDGLSWFASMVLDNTGNLCAWGSATQAADLDPGPGTHSVGINIAYKYTFFLSLDTNGNFVWGEAFYMSSPTGEAPLVPDEAGNLYICNTYGPTMDFDWGPGTFTMTCVSDPSACYILKITDAGNFIWARQFVGPGYCTPKAMALDPSGNIAIAGTYSGTIDFDPGPGTHTISNTSANENGFICRLDANGNYLDLKTFDGDQTATPFDISFDMGGNLYCGGVLSCKSGIGSHVDLDPGAGTYTLGVPPDTNDIFVSKWKPDGSLAWCNLIGVSQSTALYRNNVRLKQQANHLYLLGEFKGLHDLDPGPGTFTLSSGSPTTTSLFLSGLDQDGRFVSAIRLPKEYPSRATFYSPIDLAIGPDHDLLICGSYAGTEDFDPTANSFTMSPNGYYNSYIVKLSSNIVAGLETQLSDKQDLLLYPNPNNGDFTLQHARGLDIIITDLLGRETMHIAAEQSDERKIEMHGLQPGLYFINAHSGSKNFTTKMMVIESHP